MVAAGAPRGQVDIIAHRGASAYAPENTLAAFERAVEIGADWFELDCTLSKDGEVVVIHDDTVDRTTDHAGTVSELDYYGDMDGYDAGVWFDAKFAGQRVPTLGQALDLARGRIGVYIEVKDSDDNSALLGELTAVMAGGGPAAPEREHAVLARIGGSDSRNLSLTRRVLDEVVRRGMQRDVVIQSFSPVVCALTCAAGPEFRTELLGCRDAGDPGVWARFLQWAPLLRVSGLNISIDDLSDDFVHNTHSAGRTVAVWTVNDAAQLEQLVQLGVDAIITDRPDVALEVRRRANEDV